MNERDISISGSFNTRDLGGYATTCGQRIAWRRAIRSATLASVDEKGISEIEKLKVTRIIDLRSGKERDGAPDPSSGFQGVEVISMPLFDDLDPGKIEGADVLLDLYIQALHTQGDVFAEIMRLIGSSPGGVIFHCTAGKDRTGLVAALLLLLAGVPEKDVVADYALTADRIKPILHGTRKFTGNIDVNSSQLQSLLSSDPLTMANTIAWMEENYATCTGYLMSNGLCSDDIRMIKRHLGLIC